MIDVQFVIPLILLILQAVTIAYMNYVEHQNHDATSTRDWQDADKILRKETCDYCKHLCYNSDGSVSCDSSFERACLTSGVRMFKEFT